MPRAPKAAKKDIHPKTLNIDYLQTLTRLQIQGLAKNYGVKANLKTEKIIADILAKADLRRSQSPRASLEGLSKATSESQEPVPPEEPLVADESVPAPRTTRRTTKRALADQPPKETKRPKRTRGGGAVAQPLHPNEHTAEIQSREPFAITEQRIDAKKHLAQADKKPASNENRASINQRRVSCAATDEVAPATTSRKPTVQDIHKLHKVLEELGKERDKLRRNLNESKMSLAYALDTLESGALLLEEMTLRRQLYEREVYRLLQADDLESMTPEARKEWVSYLEEEGWNEWTPELL